MRSFSTASGNPQLPLRWHARMAECVFKQWDGMAEMKAFSAGRCRDGFYVVDDIHQH